MIRQIAVVLLISLAVPAIASGPLSEAEARQYVRRAPEDLIVADVVALSAIEHAVPDIHTPTAVLVDHGDLRTVVWGEPMRVSIADRLEYAISLPEFSFERDRPQSPFALSRILPVVASIAVASGGSVLAERAGATIWQSFLAGMIAGSVTYAGIAPFR